MKAQGSTGRFLTKVKQLAYLTAREVRKGEEAHPYEEESRR